MKETVNNKVNSPVNNMNKKDLLDQIVNIYPNSHEHQEHSARLFREVVDLDFFKVFFEPARYDLIEYIWMHPNESITEISGAFKQDRSVISRHLDALYKQNILIKTKESRYTYYEINRDTVLEKFHLITAVLEKLSKQCK